MTLRSFVRNALPVGVSKARQLARAADKVGVSEIHPFTSEWRESAEVLRVDLLPAGLFSSPGILVDVGAHHGSWIAAALRLNPHRRALVIDASPESGAVLRTRFGHDERVALHEVAVSDTSEHEAPFHVFSSSVFNSLLPMSAGVGEHYAEVSEQGVVSVPVTTLDALTGDQDVTLLKLDVQGVESAVLRGAQETLARTAALMVEMNFVSHYDGDRLFHDLHRQLIECRFHLHSIGTGYKDETGRVLWTDAVYVHDR